MKRGLKIIWPVSGIAVCLLFYLVACNQTKTSSGFSEDSLDPQKQKKKIRQVKEYISGNKLEPKDSLFLTRIENYDSLGLLQEAITIYGKDTGLIYCYFYDPVSHKPQCVKIRDKDSTAFSHSYEQRYDHCGHLTMDSDFNVCHRYGYLYDSACRIAILTDTFRGKSTYLSADPGEPYTTIATFNGYGEILSVIKTFQIKHKGSFENLYSDTTVFNYTHNNKMQPLTEYSNHDLVAVYAYNNFDSCILKRTFKGTIPHNRAIFYNEFRQNIGSMDSASGNCITITYNHEGYEKESWHYNSYTFFRNGSEIKKNCKYTLYSSEYSYY